MDLKNIQDVVNNYYCVGCGACAVHGKGASMELNKYGEYLPDAGAFQSSKEVAEVCPFLNPEWDEDHLAEDSFGTEYPHHSKIGFHAGCYGARVLDRGIREGGTSGGMGTWVALDLLRRGKIDGVIHAKAIERKKGSDPFFKYDISRSEVEVRAGAKTRYHVMEISGVMREVRETPGNYLFIGVPCFCKAVRRLQKIDPLIKERVRYVFSLVCGHYKSVNWTLSLGWGAGVAPEDLSVFQYRTKGEGIEARAYVFQATKKDGSVVQKDSAEVVGGKFNAGAMMLNACDFCDDVVGETADLTIGDAWLPKFAHDPGGTNLLIPRTKEMHDALLDGANRGEIKIQEISADEAASSQSGGFRQRREGLSYRLAKAQRAGKPTPIKRVEPGSVALSPLRKKIYDLRQESSKLSRESFTAALNEGDYEIYRAQMQAQFKKLRRLELLSSFWRAAFKRIATKFHAFLSKR